jgi:hypothetical protein
MRTFSRLHQTGVRADRPDLVFTITGIRNVLANGLALGVLDKVRAAVVRGALRLVGAGWTFGESPPHPVSCSFGHIIPVIPTNIYVSYVGTLVYALKLPLNLHGAINCDLATRDSDKRDLVRKRRPRVGGCRFFLSGCFEVRYRGNCRVPYR